MLISNRICTLKIVLKNLFVSSSQIDMNHRFLATLILSSLCEEQHHVILEERWERTSKNKYLSRPRVDADSKLSDDLERSMIMKLGGQLCGENLAKHVYEVFRRENAVVIFSHQHTIGQRTSVPTEIFLRLCKSLIERKFNDFKFGGLSIVDLNESENDPNLMFVTNNYLIPSFVATDVDGPPSNEVHLLVLEVISFRDKDDFNDSQMVEATSKFFLDQGYENDNTWVGIYEYGDIEKTFLMPQTGESGLTDNEGTDNSLKKASTIVAENQSSWATIQRFLDEAQHAFTYSLAYRLFEMVGIKDPTTGEITYLHPQKIQLGVPIPVTKT